jgi:Effector Associated Constant Component 1
MQARISLVEGDQAEFESLHEWLAQERELAGQVTSAGASPQPGQLGALNEVLIVSAGSGGVLSVLAASLKAWISLPHRSDLRIKVQGADGRVVEIDAKRVSGDRIVTLVQQALAPGISGE